jgi:uncharacterized protein YjiS (DUF1127 family)
MCVTDRNALDYNRLAPEEWDRLRRQAMQRAHVERARALRDVIGGGVRALRAAAVSALLGAAAETAVTTARKWWRAYAPWRERKAAVRELRALDDRMLRDIGVNRSEIEWVVYGQDATRLRDASIATNRSRRRDARSGATARVQQTSKQAIRKSAA